MKRSDFVKQTQKQLIARRDALRRTLAGDIGSLRALHEGSVGDEIDAAIATEQAELNSQMASYESRELRQIENALEKIRRGRYGRCEVCDRPIAAMRLKAVPYATECIDCARREERRSASASRSGPVNRLADYLEDDSETPDEALEEIG
jgi:DnaK suppressor protein